MKTALHGPPSRPRSRSASKQWIWRPNALRSARMSITPRCSRSSMISPAHVPSSGRPRCGELAQRLGQALALDAERHRRRLAAGQHEPVEPLEVGRHAHLAHVGAEARAAAARAPRSRPGARGRRRSGARLPALTSRGSRGPALVELARLERLHRRAEALARPAATRSASWKCVVASTIARPRARRGPRDLKMPEPTNTPSAPSCITARRRPAWRCRRRRTARPAACRPRRRRRTRSSGAP